jgi:hypothetical protein
LTADMQIEAYTLNYWKLEFKICLQELLKLWAP